MWIFTNAGFVSAVQHRLDHDYLMIRARDEESLITMVEGIELNGVAEDSEGNPIAEDLSIWSEDKSDYKWRCVVSKATFGLWLQYEVLNFLDYDNYKSSLTATRGEVWHKAAMGVWCDMLKVTDGPEEDHWWNKPVTVNDSWVTEEHLGSEDEWGRVGEYIEDVDVIDENHFDTDEYWEKK